ncbi:MAG TPA: phage tail sheath subtilisin-like domain-containing protein, partial [Chitinophagaceae bacterium]|nr:phage tail sheath subtilisin-like domain-containing protein [Chitinophagaceae bacterium]
MAVIQSAVPVFIGYTEKAVKKGEELKLKPTRIKSPIEYEEWFGKGARSGDIEISVDESEANPRRPEVLVTKLTAPAYKMYEALQLYFNNGGGPCWIISVGTFAEGGTPDADELKKGIPPAVKVKDITILVFPDGTGADADDTINKYSGLITDALKHCEKMKNRVTLIDVPDRFGMDEVEEKFQDKMPVDIDIKKYGIAYYPFLASTLAYAYDPKKVKVTKHLKADGTDGDLKTKTLEAIGAGKAAEGEAPAEKPNELIAQKIIGAISNYPVVLPPSSAVAGVYVRTDALQGVWKAPANVSVFGVIKPTLDLDDDDHATLNAPSNGKAINVIRAFPGRGLLVYGARTLAANSLEWRYVNVRRTFCFI